MSDPLHSEVPSNVAVPRSWTFHGVHFPPVLLVIPSPSSSTSLSPVSGYGHSLRFCPKTPVFFRQRLPLDELIQCYGFSEHFPMDDFQSQISWLSFSRIFLTICQLHLYRYVQPSTSQTSSFLFCSLTFPNEYFLLASPFLNGSIRSSPNNWSLKF